MSLGSHLSILLASVLLFTQQTDGLGSQHAQNGLTNLYSAKTVTTFQNSVGSPLLFENGTSIDWEMVRIAAFDRRIAKGETIAWDNLGDSMWLHKWEMVTNVRELQSSAMCNLF